MQLHLEGKDVFSVVALLIVESKHLIIWKLLYCKTVRVRFPNKITSYVDTLSCM